MKHKEVVEVIIKYFGGQLKRGKKWEDFFGELDEAIYIDTLTKDINTN